MKRIIILTILSFFVISCQSDNFYNTERIIILDKEVYKVRDKIHLSLKISPLSDKEKKIRVYENYRNIEVSFALINDQEDIFNGDWSKPSSTFLPKSTITEIIISKDKPFVLELEGKISMDDQFLYLHFPQIAYKVKFDKSLITDNTYIRVHGKCVPINPELGASLEEYFTVKDFKVEL